MILWPDGGTRLPQKPNVLLIIVDQFRADLLEDGALGRVVRLSNLRALMDEAVTFRRHYTVATPCGPSRVSMLTGQYAMNHRSVRNGTPLRHDTPNLPTEARKASYEPLLFGYTDTAHDPRVLASDDPRLNTYEELMPGFTEVVRMRQESGDAEWREALIERGIDLQPYPASYRPAGNQLDSPAQYPAELSDTAFLTDRFLECMEGREPGWFAALTYIRPHPPWVAPAPYNQSYKPEEMPPAVGAARNAEHPTIAVFRSGTPPSSMVAGFPELPSSDETTAALRALYLGLAEEVDHHIGRVVNWLKESGQWDNTFLIFTSDHGEMLGDHGAWGKRAFYDASFHVPLIIRDPARLEMHGRQVTSMTETIDVMPTVLERIGADVPHSVNGQSLLGILDDVRSGPRAATMSEVDLGDPVAPTIWMKELDLSARDAHFAVFRTDRYRLIQFGGDLPQILFDMEGEGERLDIASDPGAVSTCLELTRKLLGHRMRSPDGTFARTIIDGGVKIGNL